MKLRLVRIRKAQPSTPTPPPTYQPGEAARLCIELKSLILQRQAALRKVAAVVVLGITLSATSVRAWAPPLPVTGHALLDACSRTLRDAASIEDVMARGYCWGAIGTILLHTDQSKVCIPPAVTMEQTLRILVQSLEAHPQVLHLGGTVIFQAVMERTFPCIPKARR